MGAIRSQMAPILVEPLGQPVTVHRLLRFEHQVPAGAFGQICPVLDLGPSVPHPHGPCGARQPERKPRRYARRLIDPGIVRADRLTSSATIIDRIPEVAAVAQW